MQYRYNGDGLLYERTFQGGTTTRYYYDDRQLLVAEGTVGSNNQVSITAGYVYDASGELQARHVPGDSGLQTYWKNGHGDVTELKNAAGDTLNRYTYDVWGNPRVVEEQTPNVLRYAGEYWDEETGLQYLRSRWYDPNLGRFINEDTYEGDKAEPSSLNLYTYVENNPLIYTDPSGEAKRGEKNALEGLGSGSGSASGSAGMGRSFGGGLGGGGGVKGGSSGSKPKPSTPSNGQTANGTGNSTSSSIKSVDDLLKGASPGRATKGKATQYGKSGGYNQALDDFNKAGVTGVKDIPGGKVGKLPDGKTINVREKSSDGRPTLEIYDGKNSIKIRYDD